MNEQHHGNLLGGAIGETTETAAQLATIIATAAQVMVRNRVRELQTEHAQHEKRADAERAMLRSEHAAARLTWAPALERPFMTTASATEAATVWAAAQPWVEYDTGAREAARRAEERLDLVFPELIDRYGQGLADGLGSVDAMVEATAVLVQSPADVAAGASAQAVAGAERGETHRDLAVPDEPATVTVDEQTVAIRAGASHAAVADAASARAVLLAAQAYPMDLRVPVNRTMARLPALKMMQREQHLTR